MKRRLLAYTRCYSLRGSLKNLATELGVTDDLLGQWRKEWRAKERAAKARGRPAERSDPETREAINECLFDLGPKTGEEVLQGLFPEVAHREIAYHLARFRILWDNGHLSSELSWCNPGLVWAMDYLDYKWNPIDGEYRSVLNVRDLASGKSLEAMPVPIETDAETAAILESLFIQYGAPLVIKRDNGGTLKGPAVREVLERYGVFVLPSPVKRPQYNGSCEAGNGAIRTKIHHIASRSGRAGCFQAGDFHDARQMLNSTSRPWGPKGPTPDEAWETRQPISESDREAFRKEVEAGILLAQEQRDEIDPTCPEKRGWKGELKKSEQTIVRRAVRNALVACGTLVIRRKGFPLPSVEQN